MGAVAPELKQAMPISNDQLGLLAAAARLLATAALTWAVATVASALAWSITVLLIARAVVIGLTLGLKEETWRPGSTTF
jgi:hypothetical protein